MKSKNSIVQDYMTRLPFELQSHETLISAAELMREKGFRHIPIFKGSKVIGLLSDRDIKFALALMGEKAKMTKVEELMSSDNLYAVSPITPLKEVAQTMAEKKIGSALVMEQETLVGIITSIDLLHAYAQS